MELSELIAATDIYPIEEIIEILGWDKELPPDMAQSLADGLDEGLFELDTEN